MAEQHDIQPLAVHDIDWNQEDIPDEHLAGFVDVHYKASKQRRQQWEQDAATQLAWARGDQQLKWDDGINDLVDTLSLMPEDIPMSQRLPVTINVIKGQILQKMALLVSRPVTWTSRPITGDDGDLAAARLTTDLLQYDWLNSENPIAGIRLMRAIWTMFCTGVIFLKPMWDPELGPMEQFDAKSSANGNGRGVVDTVMRFAETLKNRITGNLEGEFEMPSGEPKLEFITGFDISEPIFTSDIDGKTSWIIHSSWVPMEEIISEYGKERVKDIKPDDNADAWISGYRAVYGRQRETVQGATVEPASHVLKHELWRPHSPAARKGHFSVVVDSQVLRKGWHPYKHGKLPFIRVVEIPDPDVFRPNCTVSNLMSLQESRNRLRSAMNSYGVMRLDPRIAFEKGAGLPANAFDPGPRTVEVAEGALTAKKIQPLEFGDIPPEVFRLDAMLNEDMKDVGGIHDASLGKRQEAGESGRRVELLQAGDARTNGIVRALVEDGLSKAGEQMIALWWEFGGEKRILGLTKGGRTETMRFKGSDLMHVGGGKGDTPMLMIEVQIEPEPDLQTELATVETLAKLKFLDPANPADERRVRRLLGGHVVRETDEDTRQRANAMDENEQMLGGKTPTLAIGDWDQQHIDEHMMATTTEQFRKAIKSKAETGRLFEAHIRGHEYQKAQKEIRPQIIASVVKDTEQMRITSALQQLGVPTAAGAGGGKPRPPPAQGGVPRIGLQVPGQGNSELPSIRGVAAGVDASRSPVARPGGVSLQ